MQLDAEIVRLEFCGSVGGAEFSRLIGGALERRQPVSNHSTENLRSALTEQRLLSEEALLLRHRVEFGLELIDDGRESDEPSALIEESNAEMMQFLGDALAAADQRLKPGVQDHHAARAGDPPMSKLDQEP